MHHEMHRQVRRFGPALAIVILGVMTGVAVPRLSVWLRPSHVEGDYRAHFKDRPEAVLVYGTADCSFCKDTRAYFQARRIPFADLDVQRNAEHFRRLQGLGDKLGVPVVLIGQRMIVGYQPQAFDEALARLPH